MNYYLEKKHKNNLDNNLINKLSFWANPILMECYAKRDKSIFYYLVVYQDDIIVAVMPIFEKKKIFLKKAYTPLDYKYTPIDFFLKNDLDKFREQNYKLSIINEIAKYLKNNYFRIHIYLDPSINDIRAFNWAGLTVYTRYTYIKKIDDYTPDSLSRETKRLLNNKAKKELHIKEIWDIDIYMSLSEQMLKRKNRNLRQINSQFSVFLNDLYNKDLCTMYVAYKNDTPLLYLIILKDIIHKKIFAFFSALSDEGKKKYGASIYVYDYIFTNLKEYITLDFAGANINTVAYFKSQFNCDLINYYHIIK